MLTYKLTLKKVFCEKETPPAWWGSDEFWISFVCGTDAGRVRTRWRQDGFDTGDTFEANHIIFEGPVEDWLFFGSLAIEVDSESRARELLDQFESDVSRWFLRRLSARDRGLIYTLIFLLLAYFQAAWLGIAVAVIVELVLWPFRARDPDILIYEIINYNANELSILLERMRTDPEFTPPPGRYFSLFPIEGDFRQGLFLSHGVGSSLIEQRRYRGSDGIYHLFLRHELFVASEDPMI
jgi:hypothetical protein